MSISKTLVYLALLATILSGLTSLVDARATYLRLSGVDSELQTVVLLNAVAWLDGDNTIIHPTVIYPSSMPMLEFELNEGLYWLNFTEPGFYHYIDSVLIDGETPSTLTKYVPMATLHPGVTLFMAPVATQAKFVFNLTVPEAAGFGWSFINAETSIYDFGTYNFGTPPSSIINGVWQIILNAAQPGTYRAYLEADQYQGFPSNFTLSEGKQLLAFAGMDASNGFIGSFKPQLVDSTVWYIGDLVVTQTSTGCSKYHWQTVDTYSDVIGFDQTDHGQGDFIAEQCVDMSPEALSCSNLVFDTSEMADLSVCGAFGDPHILKFDGMGVTCGYESTITLIDNSYFAITAHTRFLNNTNNATAIDGITLTYKSACNPTSTSFNDVAQLEDRPFNAPQAGYHTIRLDGNNVYVDALHLRLQVRYSGAAVLFGISMPSALVSLSSGICVNSCNPGTFIDETAITRKRGEAHMELALDACTDLGLTAGTFEYNACIFDVASTGNSMYAQGAVEISSVREELVEAWTAVPLAESPSDAPSGSPPSTSPSSAPSSPSSGSPSSSPTATIPTGNASATQASVILLAIAAAVGCFI